MFRFCVAALLCLLSVPAWPDSDGYFCVGRDYIAFELSFSGQDHTHRLHVMRFHDPSRWTEHVTVELPDFQTHGLKCEPSMVSLAGWDSIYNVGWRDASSTPVLVQTPKSPGAPDGSVFPDSLGSLVFGPQREVALPSRDPGYSYVLQIRRTPDPANRCKVLVRSSIAQRAGAAVVSEHELFSGTIPAECGE